MKRFCILLLSGLLFLSAGCNKISSPVKTLSAAQGKFEKICKDELKQPVVTRLLSNTFWVYVPIEHPMFDFKATPKLPPGFGKTPQKYSVLFLDGSFHDKTFDIQYDIVPATKEPKEYGYTTAYTEEYYKLQNSLLSALSRAFFDLDDNDKSVKAAHEKMPDFFVLVIADITRGLETRSTFYSQDFKKYMTQTLAFDEYSKRYISETQGDEDIVGDKRGASLTVEDVTWPDFLAKQILNRIRFKYQRSDFPPDGEIYKEVLRTVEESVGTYNFKDFDLVKLADLRAKTHGTFTKAQLAEYKSEEPQTTSNQSVFSFPGF